MSVSEAIATEEYPTSYLERRLPEEPPSINELLEHRREPWALGWIMDFGTGPGNVYNSSASVWDSESNRWISAVREENGGEFSSQIRFSSRVSDNPAETNRYEPNISNLSELSLPYICQDPSLKRIYDDWFITQVEVDPKSLNNASQDAYYTSAVYAGKRLDNLRLIARSPNKMKGVHLVGLPNRRIGIFTRPQCPGDPARGGLGKAGFTVVESPDEITIDVLAAAPLIPELFSDEAGEWGGVNDAFLLPNGDLAVLGHIARFEPSEIKDSRGYYPIFFTFNPNSGQVNHLQILATVTDLRFNGQIKAARPDLENVFYPSALWFPNRDITSPYAVLTGGIKDSEMAAIYIPNPLDGWLKAHPEYDVQSLGRPRLYLQRKVLAGSLAA